MYRNPLSRWLLAAVLWGGAFGALAATPAETVQKTSSEVIAALQVPTDDTAHRREQIREIIRPRFDIRAMAQSILALNWKRATEAERDRFVELFARLLENTYIVAMESYTGESVRVEKERVEDDRALVNTLILSKGKEIPVDYRMRRVGDQWFAYDVIIEGVSLISNYRNSFRRIVGNEGMAGLLEQLEQKVSGS